MAQMHVPILVDWDDIKDHMAKSDIVEVVRCKDCKYCDRGIDEGGNPFLKCLGWVYGGTQGDDFCSHAERRTDEAN